uniref:Protein kinase domain-containing protein n=1 Tax=Macrostomum lignano TaxID=282301 RepID=A0A1I8FJQ2_9PLAT
AAQRRQHQHQYTVARPSRSSEIDAQEPGCVVAEFLKQTGYSEHTMLKVIFELTCHQAGPRESLDVISQLFRQLRPLQQHQFFMYDSWKYPLLLKFPSNSAGPSGQRIIKLIYAQHFLDLQWCNQSARTWTRGPTRNDNSTFGNIHLPLFIDSRILPNSKRHYSQISCGFDLDYRPGYSILLRISHNLGFEDIDFYCHSKLSSRDVNPHIVLTTRRRDSNSPGNWIEEQLEMCHGYSIGSLGTKSRLLIDGSVGISLLALKNDMMERLAGRWDGRIAALLPGAAVPLPEQWAAGLPEHFGQQHEAGGSAGQDAREQGSRGIRLQLSLSRLRRVRPAHDSRRKAAGAAAATRSLVICGDYSSSSRVLYMALTADLPDIQISYSAIETGIKCGLVFLAIVLTLLLLGCLLFINREAVGSRVHAVLQLRQSRTEDTLQLTRGDCLLTASAPHQYFTASSSGNAFNCNTASTEERLARPLTRQRGEEAEVADVDFVLQEAPQRIVVRVSLVTLVCCWAARRRSGPTAPTASAGWARRTCCSSLSTSPSTTCAAQPIRFRSIRLASLKKAKEGSTPLLACLAVCTGGELPYPGCDSPTRLAAAEAWAPRTGVYPVRPHQQPLPGRQCSTKPAPIGQCPCSGRHVPHPERRLVRGCATGNLTLESNGNVRAPDLASLLSVYAPDTDGVLGWLASSASQPMRTWLPRESHLEAKKNLKTRPVLRCRRPEDLSRLGDCRPRLGVLLGSNWGAADQNRAGLLRAIVEDGLGVICSRQDMWKPTAELNESRKTLCWHSTVAVACTTDANQCEVPVSGLYGGHLPW